MNVKDAITGQNYTWGAWLYDATGLFGVEYMWVAPNAEIHNVVTLHEKERDF